MIQKNSPVWWPMHVLSWRSGQGVGRRRWYFSLGMNVQGEDALGFCQTGLEGDQCSLETIPGSSAGRIQDNIDATSGPVEHCGEVSHGGRYLAAACGWGARGRSHWRSMTHCSRRPKVSPSIWFCFCASATYCISGLGALASA